MEAALGIFHGKLGQMVAILGQMVATLDGILIYFA